MKTLIIRRISTGVHGTFGGIIYEETPIMLSLEREWINNERGISCIPAGTYTCSRVDSPKFGDTFEVTDVVGRKHILFHWGNLDDDSHGCILTGSRFGEVKGSPGVHESKKAFNKMMAIMKEDDLFRLIVVDDWKNPIN